jgi:hypothetical protein
MDARHAGKGRARPSLVVIIGPISNPSGTEISSPLSNYNDIIKTSFKLSPRSLNNQDLSVQASPHRNTSVSRIVGQLIEASGGSSGRDLCRDLLRCPHSLTSEYILRVSCVLLRRPRRDLYTNHTAAMSRPKDCYHLHST